MNSKTYKLNLDGKDLIIEINDLAQKANGSVMVRLGDTLILSTCCMSKKDREFLDFFPLSVGYEERYYAAGKILGSRYMRREGRPSDEAVLTARLIDRAIRPLFPEKLKRREVQAIITCLSWDKENDPDTLGLIGASAALSISDIPWNGPVGAVRVGKIGDKFILNPTYQERQESELDFVLAGISDNGKVSINMIEAEGKELPENVALEAIAFAEPYIEKIINFQKEIMTELGKEKADIKELTSDTETEEEIRTFLGDSLEKALFSDKKEKSSGELEGEVISFLKEKYSDPSIRDSKINYAKGWIEKEVDRLVHKIILDQKAGEERRSDQRKLDELRKISCVAGPLPRTHGSSIFMRGETKSLSILTLGAPGDQRLLEGMEIIGKKRFMHHYNFPPSCVGEVAPMRGPGRREIGHGMLAEKALAPILPDHETFPYTIRIVTEILSSNGSSSMASVSSSSLALMDAGVPIKRPATGIAMGLIMNEETGAYKILTDIQGPEDHYGDMDCKVAGTREGITAIQMDVKVKGVNLSILKETLEKAKNCREKILDEIERVLPKPREDLSPWAPKILTFQIKPDKIREVIGPGGKIINEIIGECEVLIDIEDNGQVFITAEKKESAEKAMSWIKNIVREVVVGETFKGKVKRILEFGAFVEILPGQEGLIHISKLAPHRVNKVEDIVKIGDIVEAIVVAIDDQGRINLALKNNNSKQ
ncbi:MAG: polyribonucleotide nucleotidyltransferase [bacterium]